jgi:hypothetical protein
MVTMVVEKITHDIFCYSLIPKFKHISFELFFIGRKKNIYIYHAILNKKRHTKDYTPIYYSTYKYK